MTTSVDTQATTKQGKLAHLVECLRMNKKRAAERSLLVATTAFLAMPAWAQEDFEDFADFVDLPTLPTLATLTTLLTL